MSLRPPSSKAAIIGVVRPEIQAIAVVENEVCNVRNGYSRQVHETYGFII